MFTSIEKTDFTSPAEKLITLKIIFNISVMMVIIRFQIIPTVPLDCL